MYRSIGTLRYSPKLNGEDSGRWWLILDADPDIGKYARYMYKVFHHHCRVLQAPSWKEHITVVRDEKPNGDRLHLWEKYAGNKVEFTYYPEIVGDGKYFWMEVDCPELLEMRAELGLPYNPLYPLHLTVGNVVGSQT